MATSIMLCSKNMEDKMVATYSKPVATTSKRNTAILCSFKGLYNSLRDTGFRLNTPRYKIVQGMDNPTSIFINRNAQVAVDARSILEGLKASWVKRHKIMSEKGSRSL